jgi:hypothetical protein
MRQQYLNKEAMLTMNYVTADFFLNRIREFEKRYEMTWMEFVAEYSKGALPGTCQDNSDYAEWNFLCSKFTAELLKSSESSPPAREENFEGQKPEAISGFCFIGEVLVRACKIPRACVGHSLESETRSRLRS